MPSDQVNFPSPWYCPFSKPPSYLLELGKVRKPRPWQLPPSNMPSQLLPSENCRWPWPSKILFLNSPWYSNWLVLSVPRRRSPCSQSPSNSCCWLNSRPLPWYFPLRNSPRQYSSSSFTRMPQPLGRSRENSPRQTRPSRKSSPYPVLRRFWSSPPRKMHPPALSSQDLSISSWCSLRSCSMEASSAGSSEARPSKSSSSSRWPQQVKTLPIIARLQ